jgi:hypothetical protein
MREFMTPLISFFRLLGLLACFILAACGRSGDEEEDFILIRLTEEEKQAELLTLLKAGDQFPQGSGNFFDETIQIDEEGGVPAGGCRPDFVAQRWRPDQYQARGFTQSTERCGLNKPPADLKPRESIPIHWLNLSTRRANATGAMIGWSDAMAETRIQEAIDWFENYCIELNVNKVNVRANRLANMRAAMTAGIQGRPFQGENVTVETVSDSVNALLYREELRRPRKYLLILFTDAYQNVRFGDPDSRINRTAGNFESIPVILVPDPPDSASTHIITHELIHGLGKVLVRQSSFPFLRNIPELENPGPEAVSLNRQATWDEGGCPFDMGNAERTDQDVPLAKPNSDKMDWASFWQFDRNGNTGIK